MRVFFDTNVLIDIVASREPFLDVWLAVPIYSPSEFCPYSEHVCSLSRLAVTSDDFIRVIKTGETRRPIAVRFHAESPALYADEVRIQVRSFR